MRRPTVAIAVFLLALVGFSSSSGLKATEFDEKTVVTFQRSVEVPGGEVLKPGTYVLTVVEHFDNRNVVRIFSTDETAVLSTFIAIPAYRLHATDTPVITYVERGAGTPQRINAWWYPGELIGQEFVY